MGSYMTAQRVILQFSLKYKIMPNDWAISLYQYVAYRNTHVCPRKGFIIVYMWEKL